MDWNQMRVAEPPGKGRYIHPGQYRVRIDRCIFKKTEMKGEAFIVEVTFLESNNLEHPVGSSGSWYQGDKFPKIMVGEMAAFVAAALGCDPQDAEGFKVLREQLPELMPRVTGAENILAGREINLETFTKQTRNGKDFTQHKWTPAEQSEAA